MILARAMAVTVRAGKPRASGDDPRRDDWAIPSMM